MTDKELKSKIADIIMEAIEEYNSNEINRPMIASVYVGEIISLINSLPEEPVSAELIEELKKIVNIRECVSQGVPVIKIACHFAQWQKEQFEKNRLEHCNSITNEQAELEQKFLDEHLDKYNRMPTFLDAIEYGMRLQKEQMMKGAFEFTRKHNDACVLASECLRDHGWFNREHDFNDLFLYLSCVDELFAGKFSGKTKVIVIKED